jgi:RsiW-degrading membrane proteinase PrsW (M82 family)
MFVYGGTLGVAAALALSITFGLGLQADAKSLVGLVVVAPLAEELAKGLGLGLVRNRILEVEDGIVYGAAIGLGFGATENLLYGLMELHDIGFTAAIATIGFRVLSSVLLHAGSTALLGYGYAMLRLRHKMGILVVPYYLLAVLQHALYNALVSTQALAGFAAAVVMVIVVTTLLRRRIRTLDARPPATVVEIPR